MSAVSFLLYFKHNKLYHSYPRAGLLMIIPDGVKSKLRHPFHLG